MLIICNDADVSKDYSDNHDNDDGENIVIITTILGTTSIIIYSKIIVVFILTDPRPTLPRPLCLSGERPAAMQTNSSSISTPRFSALFVVVVLASTVVL